MASPIENYIALFNEFLVSLYLYILMLLTDFMGESNMREQYGQALMGVIGVGVLINFVKFSVLIIIELKNKRMLKKKRED